jgi:hypothetical protein
MKIEDINATLRKDVDVLFMDAMAARRALGEAMRRVDGVLEAIEKIEKLEDAMLIHSRKTGSALNLTLPNAPEGAYTSTCGDVQLWFDWANKDDGVWP